MILKFIKQTVFQQPIQYKFASAAAAAIDYYSLLGLQRGATTEQIKQAFKRITTNVTPDNNPTLFGRLNQAFIILSDGRTRDAYDSLVRSRKVSFASIREKEEKPKAPNSYIADRKAEKEKQWAKRYNLDKFGRYKGGIPNRTTFKRGKSLGETGELFNQRDAIDANPFPQFTQIDSAKAESFKNYHQKQRENRTAKPTWMTVEVDYHYFSLGGLNKYWRIWRWILLFTILMPVIVPYQLGFWKRMNVWMANRKKQQRIEKAEKEAKEKQQKQKQARQKQAKEQEKLAKEAEAREQAEAQAQAATAQSQ